MSVVTSHTRDLRLFTIRPPHLYRPIHVHTVELHPTFRTTYINTHERAQGRSRVRVNNTDGRNVCKRDRKFRKGIKNSRRSWFDSRSESSINHIFIKSLDKIYFNVCVCGRDDVIGVKHISTSSPLLNYSQIRNSSRLFVNVTFLRNGM